MYKGKTQSSYTIHKTIPFISRQGDLVNTLLMCLVLAFVIKFIAHTAILNAYLNMMAELMGFADRQFFSVCKANYLYGN